MYLSLFQCNSDRLVSAGDEGTVQRGFVILSVYHVWQDYPGKVPGRVERKVLGLVLSGWSNKYEIFPASCFHYNLLFLQYNNFIFQIKDCRHDPFAFLSDYAMRFQLR